MSSEEGPRALAGALWFTVVYDLWRILTTSWRWSASPFVRRSIHRRGCGWRLGASGSGPQLQTCLNVGSLGKRATRVIWVLKIEYISFKLQKTQNPPFKLWIQVRSQWGEERQQAQGGSGWVWRRSEDNSHRAANGVINNSQHAIPAVPLLMFRKRWFLY